MKLSNFETPKDFPLPALFSILRLSLVITRLNWAPEKTESGERGRCFGVLELGIFEV